MNFSSSWMPRAERTTDRPQEDGWSNFRQLPGGPRRGCVAVPVDEHRVVILGGKDRSRNSVPSILLYNSRSGGYVTRLPPMNQARFGCGAAVCRIVEETTGRITYCLYAFGGEGLGGVVLKSAEYLNLTPFLSSHSGGSGGVGVWNTTTVQQAWRELPPMKCKRKGLAAVCVTTSAGSNEIYVMGGHSGTSSLSVVEVLEVRGRNSHRWKPAPTGSASPLELNYRRSWFGATAVATTASGESSTTTGGTASIVVVGGQVQGPSDSCEILHLNQGSFVELSTKLSTPRLACSIVAIGTNQVAVVGGRDHKTMNDIDLVEVLEVGDSGGGGGAANHNDEDSLRFLPPLKTPRSELAAASLFPPQRGAIIMVFGGFSSADAAPVATTEHLQLSANDTNESEMKLQSQGCRFIQACADGDLYLVERHLQQTSRAKDIINFRDYDLRTPLHLAASEGQLEVVKLLVERRAKLGTVDRWGNAPLDAAMGHHPDVAAYLQEAEEFLAEGGELIDACNFGDGSKVLDIIKRRPALANFFDYDFRTPLHVAASEGHTSVVKVLVDHGANINSRDRFHNTPLDDARQQWHKHSNSDNIVRTSSFREVMAILEDAVLAIEEGCKLLDACKGGDLSIVEEHLQRRPTDVTFADYDKRTPMHLAVCEGHLSVVRLLVTRGAPMDGADRWGHTPLDDARCLEYHHIADYLERAKEGIKEGKKLILAASQGNLKRVQRHLDTRPLDVNFADYDGRTALHLAAAEGHLEVSAFLLEKGADVNSLDRWGNLPVFGARSEGRTQVAALLEEKERAVLAVSKLIDACAKGDAAVIQAHLKERPNDVNLSDYDKRTPLHLASSNGRREVVELLLRRGADADSKDRWGYTALDDAVRHSFGDIARILQQASTMPVKEGARQEFAP